MHRALNISTIYRIGGARTTWRILRFLVKHRLKTQRTHMQSTHLHANFIRHSYDGFNTEELSPQQLFRNLHKSWWNRLHSFKIELQNIYSRAWLDVNTSIKEPTIWNPTQDWSVMAYCGINIFFLASLHDEIWMTITTKTLQMLVMSYNLY